MKFLFREATNTKLAKERIITVVRVVLVLKEKLNGRSNQKLLEQP